MNKNGKNLSETNQKQAYKEKMFFKDFYQK
jgi:hypothetical protein